MKIVLFANTAWYLFHFRSSLVAAMQNAGHDVLLISPPGPYGDSLLAMGYQWQPAPMVRTSLNPLRELALVWWLRRLFKREGVDLVHGFTIKSAIYGALAGRYGGVSARVSSITGLGYVFVSDDVKARVLRPLVRTLFRLVLAGPGTRVILQNADDTALFRSARLVDPASMRMIPSSGVDCDRFKPHPPVADPRISGCPAEARRFRVLLPTRLLWHKGLAEYVEAGRLLRAEGRAVDLLLAGEPDPGNPASVPATTVREWVKRGWVQWLGYVEDMASLLRTVDAVVFPSYREGLPKGLAEGAAAGLPLIATNVPGCRDVVTDGVEGLLVPPRDGPALAAAIRRLQDDPELRARMGAAARAKALAEYDERIVIQRTFAVYQELLPGFR